MKQIYSTAFDPTTLQAIRPSAPVGFDSLDEVVAVLGPDYVRRSPRTLIYPGVAFSDYIFTIDGPDTSL